MTSPGNLFLEEILRNVHADACAVTGLSVGIDSAAVIDVFQGADTHFNDFPARISIQRDDQTDTAGVMLVFRGIGVSVDEFLTVVEIGFSIVSHVTTPHQRIVEGWPGNPDRSGAADHLQGHNNPASRQRRFPS